MTDDAGHISGADRLILHLLREDWSALVDGTGRPVDWDAVLTRAKAHGVGPLLYHKLRSAGRLEVLPADSAQALQRAYYTAAALNTLHSEALEAILKSLATCGITPILLKGAGLVATVYDSPALRPMADLDLLVLPAELRPALQCLGHLGYWPTHAEQYPGAYEAVTHHVGLRREAPFALLVELHHHWLSLPGSLSRYVSMEEVRERAITGQVGQAQAWVLAPADQVLHLSAHVAIHSPAPARLIWHYDLDQVIRQYKRSMDWSLIVQRAVDYHMVLPLQRVLPAVVGMFATPVPAEVLEELGRISVDPREQQRYAPSALGPRSRLVDGLQKMSGLEGTGAKLKFVWQMLFPSWAYMSASYPNESLCRRLGRYPARWSSALRELITAWHCLRSNSRS
jgi:hypothetical protein